MYKYAHHMMLGTIDRSRLINIQIPRNNNVLFYSTAAVSSGPYITKTSPCNEHPLTFHFYIVKLGFTGVYIFSYFCSETYIVGTR